MERRIQITSGRGPKECNLAVQHVWRKLQGEAARQDIVCAQEEVQYQDGLPCSIIGKLQGTHVDSFIKKWFGTIQWICQSPYRPHCKRKNWFVAVVGLANGPEHIELSDADVAYEAIRSSGPGGQHVNKVSSAIQATHLSSGIAVQVMDTRSQWQNKQLAFERLKQKLDALHQGEIAQLQNQQWQNQVAIARGNPIQTFVGPDFRKK